MLDRRRSTPASALSLLRALSPQCGLVVVTLLCAPARGAEFRGGDVFTVAEGETVDGDLYASGETITIDGTVLGDLVAAGRLIRVNGTVEGDLIAAAQAVVVSGSVSDDIRMAGQALQLGGSVGGHVVAFGFSLEALPGSRIGEDLVFRGAQGLLAGSIGGDLSSATRGLSLHGAVDGDAEISVGSDGEPTGTMFWPPPIDVPAVRGGLDLSGDASVGGRLAYRAPAEVAIAPETAIGGGVEAEILPPEGEDEAPSIGARLARSARRFAALLVLGALVLWRLPGWTAERVRHLRSRPFSSLGWGLAGVAAAATASLLLVVLGIALAFALGALQLGNLSLPVLLVGLLGASVVAALLVIALFWLAQIIVGLGLGSLLLRSAETPGRQAFAALALGLLLYVALRLVPVVGWILAVIVALLGFGAVLESTFRQRRGRPASLETS